MSHLLKNFMQIYVYILLIPENIQKDKAYV